MQQEAQSLLEAVANKCRISVVEADSLELCGVLHVPNAKTFILRFR